MLEINQIHAMDCIKGMRKLDDCCIDVIVTSPPYNIGVNYQKLNKFELAQKFYQKTLDVDPDHINAQNSIIKIRDTLNRRRKQT